MTEKKNIYETLFPDELVMHVRQIIRSVSPSGLSEYDLIKKIDTQQFPLVKHLDFTNPQKLFPFHFLLFHHLYRWRETLVQKNEGLLSISALFIRFSPAGASGSTGSNVADFDAMSAFYLDIENLEKTAGAELERMLDNFWKKIVHRPDIDVALETLEIDRLESREQVKRQYRKLVSKAHPDRGGCERHTQQLNQAKSVLLAQFER